MRERGRARGFPRKPAHAKRTSHLINSDNSFKVSFQNLLLARCGEYADVRGCAGFVFGDPHVKGQEQVETPVGVNGSNEWALP